jgi:uncharacterized protein (TIGR03067 family)
MRFVACLAGLSFLAGVVGAPKPSGPEWDADLIGSWWGVESVDPDGRTKLDAIWQVKEGVLIYKDHPLDTPDEWGYSVNLGTTPRQIDLRPNAGPAKGKTLKGVYLIEKERLTVCYVSPGAKEPEKVPRPTVVDKPGADYVVLRFKR